MDFKCFKGRQRKRDRFRDMEKYLIFDTVSDMKRCFTEILKRNLLFFKVCKAIIHQCLCIGPFAAFIRGPAAGKDTAGKREIFPLCSSDKAISGFSGETGFDSQSSVVRGEKGIVIGQRIRMTFFVRDRFGRCPNDLQEIFVLAGVGGKPAHICRCALVTLCIQSVGRYEMGSGQAEFCRFLVHFIGKAFDRAADMLGDSDRRVIVGFQHKGVQEIIHGKRTAF